MTSAHFPHTFGAPAHLRGNLLKVALIAAIVPSTLCAQTNVLTQHNDNFRTGANLTETTLRPANVNAQHFGMLFKHPVDDQLYTQPLIVTNVEIAGGTHDLVLVTTVNNSVYAFDANDAKATMPFWHVNFGTPANLHDANFGCLDINGNMGIIGAPVIDAATRTLYVVALTRAGDHFIQRLHALDIATGADLPSSPTILTAPDFDPLMQNQRPALALANGKVYIGYASHCDKLPYHGFLLSYDATTLHQAAVFNTSPGGEGASIWQSGQAPTIDPDGNIIVITGNGTWDGKRQFSESFLKLDPNLKLLDWFTPTNHLLLDKMDNDLDSTGATLIPGSHVVLGGGKEGVLYSIDTAHFGGLGDEHAAQHFQATSSHLHSLVFWDSAVNGRVLYLWGQRDKLRGYKFQGDHLNETPWVMRPEANNGHPGAMLSLSANGKRDGILWAAIHASGDSWHESRPGILHAYEADDISHELWNSLETPARDDCGNYSKMAPPTIANGKVYLASFGAENTGTGQFCAYGLLPEGAPPAAPGDVRAAVVVNDRVRITWKGVPRAETYTVFSTQDGVSHVAASGLTGTHFSEPTRPNSTTKYTVIAVNTDGESASSTPADVKPQSAPMKHMHH